MMAADPRHLIRAYRDLELLDRDDRHRGVVDDIEIAEREPGICGIPRFSLAPERARRRPRGLHAVGAPGGVV